MHHLETAWHSRLSCPSLLTHSDSGGPCAVWMQGTNLEGEEGGWVLRRWSCSLDLALECTRYHSTKSIFPLASCSCASTVALASIV
jgi:hypothetical protein